MHIERGDLNSVRVTNLNASELFQQSIKDELTKGDMSRSQSLDLATIENMLITGNEGCDQRQYGGHQQENCKNDTDSKMEAQQKEWQQIAAPMNATRQNSHNHNTLHQITEE